MKLKFVLALTILLSLTRLYSEDTNEIHAMPIGYKAPESVKGHHYYLMNSVGPMTINQIESIGKSAESYYFALAGFKADLVIKIQAGFSRKRKADGTANLPNPTYVITIQHIEKYFDDGRYFPSTMGVLVELDSTYRVIK